ncbi:MAG: hypothetical protein HRT57_04210 [Crocinitomicaceae bacterium]|nr:hypothetical protein [Crocinitomicaceae bacterium]
MASKKLLKKRLKGMVFEILNDCDEVIVNEGKNADKADSLIDEAVDFHDEVIAKINVAKSKKDFNDIIADVTKAAEDFDKKVKSL